MSHPVPPPRSDLKWACVDLDGTLAEPIWTPQNPTTEIGRPIARNVIKLASLHNAGYKIVIHTSRPDTDYEAIEMWLNHYGLPFKAIRTGKPLAAIYVDDRGVHSEHPDWVLAAKEAGKS